jgi:hypothetical protein
MMNVRAFLDSQGNGDTPNRNIFFSPDQDFPKSIRTVETNVNVLDVSKQSGAGLFAEFDWHEYSVVIAMIFA